MEVKRVALTLEVDDKTCTVSLDELTDVNTKTWDYLHEWATTLAEVATDRLKAATLTEGEGTAKE